MPQIIVHAQTPDGGIGEVNPLHTGCEPGYWELWALTASTTDPRRSYPSGSS
jgi:hypothetical protein